MGPRVERVCAAIVRDGRILMVRHREDDGRDFWTLPGGGAEPGESLGAAVLREVAEEVRLVGTLGPILYERRYVSRYGARSDVRETCFLVDVQPGAEPALGYDPEMAPDAQVLAGVGWFDLATVAGDKQVSRALPALRIHVSEVREAAGQSTGQVRATFPC
jgi:8-oxo-dGTP diphosphatase